MKKRTKRTLAVSGKVLLRLVLASILCVIMYLSMMFIATGMFSDVIGYQIHEEKENGDIVLVDEHYYVAGEKHLTRADVEDDQALTELREVPQKTLMIFNILSQIMMLIVFAIFPYHILWEFGNRDDTKVRYKGQRPDPYRGFRVGALATIPHTILWALLLLVKGGLMPDGYVEIYRWVNIPYMPFINWITSNGDLRNTALWKLLLMLLMLLYIPIISGISYRMGHNQFSLREHLVFAKKKDPVDDEI